jgi:hypothetical protein
MHRSASTIVSKRRTVPEALSPQMQVANSPVLRDPTRLKMRIESSYGPQLAVAYIHLRFMESHCHHRLGTELGQIDDICCSAKDNVSKQWTVPWALSPYMQVVSLPVTQVPTRLKTCICHSYGPKKAAASTNLRCPQSSQHRCLEVLRRRRHDTIRMKCSDSNVISVTKPTALLASCSDPGNCLYSPGLVPRESGHHGRLEQDCKRLRVCYTPRNQGE